MPDLVNAVHALGERDQAESAPAIAWAELVPIVHAQMTSIAGPSSDLEDLTQTALEQVGRALHRFEARSDIRTFTYRICVNVALNHWRSWRRWFRHFDLRSADEVPSAGRGPYELSRERQRSERLHVALARLSPVMRVVITLADLEDVPTARIAELIGCPEPTVRSRLRKARARLMRLLARDPAFCNDEVE